MSNIINSYTLDTIEKTILFFIVCFLVMIYYYVEEWIKNKSSTPLIDYLIINNPEATYDAIKRTILLAFGAGVMGQLDQVSNTDLLIAAAGVGWLAFSNRSNK